MRVTPGHLALRLGRHSEAGRIYLVTATCARRSPVFREWEPASAAARALCCPTPWRKARLLCWVLMPDHMHLVIELGDEDLASLVNRVKAVTAKAVNTAMRSNGRIWSRAFHDHALRNSEGLVDMARYV